MRKIGAAVSKVKSGNHVVISFNSFSYCASCHHDDPAYCLHINQANFSGHREDGSRALSAGGVPIYSQFFGQISFAKLAICTERNVVCVPKDIRLELLGPLSCGFQTGAGAVLNLLKVLRGSVISIFGAGAVGLAAVMAAKIAGAKTIIAAHMQETRLNTALSLGATHVIKAVTDALTTQLKDLVDVGLDYALDTTGNEVVIRTAVEFLAPHGVRRLISSGHGPSINLNLLQMMLGGRNVRGIHQGESVPDIFISQLIDFYRQGRFPLDQLISFYGVTDIIKLPMIWKAEKLLNQSFE